MHLRIKNRGEWEVIKIWKLSNFKIQIFTLFSKIYKLHSENGQQVKKERAIFLFWDEEVKNSLKNDLKAISSLLSYFKISYKMSLTKFISSFTFIKSLFFYDFDPPPLLHRQQKLSFSYGHSTCASSNNKRHERIWRRSLDVSKNFQARSGRHFGSNGEMKQKKNRKKSKIIITGIYKGIYN